MTSTPSEALARLASGHEVERITWRQVCADQSLQRLPYRLELNRRNKIEASPVESYHEVDREVIIHLLHTLKPGGRTVIKCAIETADNVKVPDLGWISFDRNADAAVSDGVYTDTAPEICVELFSPRNLLAEKLHKGQLYLQAGAEEFWLCNELGDMSFFDVTGPLERSRLCPDFPTGIELHRQRLGDE